MSTTALIVILLILLLLGGGGDWGYSSRRYQGPGLLWVVALILLVLFLTGRL